MLHLYSSKLLRHEWSEFSLLNQKFVYILCQLLFRVWILQTWMSSIQRFNTKHQEGITGSKSLVSNVDTAEYFKSHALLSPKYDYMYYKK